MTPPVLVFVGGGAGAVMRWGLAQAFATPAGTILANVVGSLLLAAMMHPRLELDPTWRLLLGTGLMGGFTTYSTFNAEVLGLLIAGEPLRAAGLALGTLLTCLVAGAVGYAITGWLVGPA